MDEALLTQLVALERRLLEPQVRACESALNALLDPSFVEFGASGRRFDRQDVVAELSTETDATFDVLDFEAVLLAPGLVQLRYRSIRHQAGQSIHARRSSLWRDDGAGWRMVFHQGTAFDPV